MLLTGTFSRVLDDKLRIAIPKRLRELLGPNLAQQGLYAAPGTDGSLSLYTEESFARLAKRLEAASPYEADVRAFSRLFYGQTQHLDVDQQGRVRIPAELAKMAGLVKEAVLVGVQDRLELWDRQRWEQYLASQSDRYDEIAAGALKAGSGPGEVRQ